MKNFLTRRDFLQRASLVALGWRGLSLTKAAPSVLRIGIIAAGDRDRADGAQLGAEEARHAAALFGGEIHLTNISESAATSHDAVIGDADADRCARLARVTLVMNVACASDALRGERCAPMLFHVAPSAAMLADAGAGATAWDPSLQRFGADTLNQRYRARFGRPMTSNAWTAWMAIKILWESSLRTRSSESGAIVRYLARDTTQFDGHKGRPLSFRAWDRQLRQPLYVRTEARLLEVPAESNADESPRASLDRLGIGQTQSVCRSTP